MLKNVCNTKKIFITVFTICFACSRPFRRSLCTSRCVKNFNFILNAASGDVEGFMVHSIAINCAAIVILLTRCLLKYSRIDELSKLISVFSCSASVDGSEKLGVGFQGFNGDTKASGCLLVAAQLCFDRTLPFTLFTLKP